MKFKVVLTKVKKGYEAVVPILNNSIAPKGLTKEEAINFAISLILLEFNKPNQEILAKKASKTGSEIIDVELTDKDFNNEGDIQVFEYDELSEDRKKEIFDI